MNTTAPRALDALLEILSELDDAIGRNWFKHASAAGAADDLLRVITADGCFTTKIDGWIHAATVTTRSIAQFALDPGRQNVDLAALTSWSGGNAALRYGRWQTDFHWKIDTRLWQYILYLKFMRDAYRDAIDEAVQLDDIADREALHRLVREFFDQAELALIYRWEVIERARGFAPHPDPTAGARDHGYAYEVLRPLPSVRFEALPVELGVERGTNAERGGSVDETKTAIPPFPRLDGVVRGGTQQLARDWLDRAREVGVADRWLCVRLGTRMVPTRFNGWESAIAITAAFLRPYADGHRIGPDVLAAGPTSVCGLELADHAVRFGLCQAEFQRRLLGGVVELRALLETQHAALRAGGASATLLDRAIPEAALDAFFTRALDAVTRAFADELAVAEGWLPELGGMRPIHPRFAPLDPLEPLPWQHRDQEGYRRRMQSLGYII